jgi:hypothetical protein
MTDTKDSTGRIARMRRARRLVGIVSAWAALTFVVCACVWAAAQQEDVHVTESGLKYKIVQRGQGAKAEIGKRVCLHGIGSFEDGKVFWSSRDDGSPFCFVLGQSRVIKGCEEGIALIRPTS